MAQMVKNPPEMGETWVQSLGRKDHLEEDMATHSSILAWRIPMDRGAGGLQSMGSQRIRRKWATKHSTRKYAFGSFSSLSFSVLVSGMVLKRTVWFESGLTVLSCRWIHDLNSTPSAEPSHDHWQTGKERWALKEELCFCFAACKLLVWHVESSSLTKGRTQVPCMKSMESEPLDQGSP